MGLGAQDVTSSLIGGNGLSIKVPEYCAVFPADVTATTRPFLHRRQASVVTISEEVTWQDHRLFYGPGKESKMTDVLYS